MNNYRNERLINSGVFAIINDLIVFLSEAENPFIKQIFSDCKYKSNADPRIKEFHHSFAAHIKEKFTKGIQFSQGNF